LIFTFALFVYLALTIFTSIASFEYFIVYLNVFHLRLKCAETFKIFRSKISRDDESTASAAVCLVEGVVAEPRLYNNVAVLELVSTGRTLNRFDWFAGDDFIA